MDFGAEILGRGRCLVGRGGGGAGRFDMVVCGAIEWECASLAGINYVELAARSVRGE